MEAKKSSGKQVVAILLLVIGLAAGVFGVLGLVGGGGMDPYEARNGVVMIGVMVQDSQGNTASGMGTGFAIGNPGEPVEYIVTNGHVVQMAYDIPELIRLSPERFKCIIPPQKMIMCRRRWCIIPRRQKKTSLF